MIVVRIVEVGREHQVEHLRGCRLAQDGAQSLSPLGDRLRPCPLAARLGADAALPVFEHPGA